MSLSNIVTAYENSHYEIFFLLSLFRASIMYGNRKYHQLLEIYNSSWVCRLLNIDMLLDASKFTPISTARDRIYTSTMHNCIKGNNLRSPFDNIFIVLYLIFIFYALVFLEISCICLIDCYTGFKLTLLP